MAKDLLGYERMLQEALRGVVRAVLAKVAAQGLPGGHHFYITFRTDHSGVDIPEFLRSQYPHEMTIVIQHQYSGLQVREDSFSVSLSFNKMPAPLTIPFDALVRFADPSVDFGLQLASMASPGENVAPAESGANGDLSALPRKARGVAETPKGKEPDGSDKASKVVTLDSFRKS